jgi:hypothetical protein
MNDACMLDVNANCTCFSYEVVQGFIVICAVVVVEETVVLVVVVAMRVIVAIVMAMTALDGVRLQKASAQVTLMPSWLLSWSSRAACDCRGCGRGFWRVWMCALHWPRHDGHCCGHIGVAEHVV